MSLILNPNPKNICLTESCVALPAVICAEPVFEKAADAFASYVKDAYDTEITAGTDGIRLYTNASLPQEGYTLTVSKENGITAAASTAMGMNRALSTLFQMIEKDGGTLSVPCASVTDEPTSSYRGLMVDLGRAWHPMEYLYSYADLCWKNRASHLHLHFTDIQNFTLPIESYPNIGHKRYTKDEMTAFAEYCEARGIQLVPEVDLPGHSSPWLEAYPEIFGSNGVLAASDQVFEAIRTIFTEVHAMFPYSKMLHFGGDEADIHGWKYCPISQEYMKQYSIESVDEMYAVFVGKAAQIILDLGCTPVVWEGFSKEYNDRIPKETIVCVFESMYQIAPELAADGFTLINTSWEPLYIVTNSKFQWPKEDILNWNKYVWKHWHQKSPAHDNPIIVTPEEANVLGGQICAWGNALARSENLAQDLKLEYNLIAERFEALCERTWNA